jgi:hypothetical protein
VTARSKLAALLVAALLAGCSGVAVTRQIDPRLPALRATGYRIAVVPFQVSAPEDAFLTSSLGPVGEVLALEGGANLPDRARLGQVMRADVLAWLAQTPFEVIDTWGSDTRLAHAGFDGDDMRQPSRAKEIAALLQVDGVLFGDVTRWNRSYYLLQSTADVGLRLELRDAGGDVLFTTSRVESVGSGITGGPTGFVSAATEPLAGLRGSNLRELMRSAARNAALDLGGNGSEPAGAADGAAAMAPRLTLVSLARARDGALRPGDRVDVIAVGTPACDVRFDLGRLRVGVPMQQVALDQDPRGPRATYAGHYVVQPGDPALALPLFCTVRRPGAHGQPTRYRWDGTIALAGPPIDPARGDRGANAEPGEGRPGPRSR